MVVCSEGLRGNVIALPVAETFADESPSGPKTPISMTSAAANGVGSPGRRAVLNESTEEFVESIL